IPILSSMERPSATAGDEAISRSVAAIACSFMSVSFWIVSSVSNVILLVEVRSTADVFVVDDGARRWLEERRAIEAVFENRLHALERRAADGQGARARRVDAVAAEAIGEANDAKARAIAGLRVRAAAHNRARELPDMRADAFGPRDDALGRPTAVLAVSA